MAKAKEDSKKRKQRIDAHRERAYECVHRALDELESSSFKEAGDELHAAAQFANLANAEVMKR